MSAFLRSSSALVRVAASSCSALSSAISWSQWPRPPLPSSWSRPSARSRRRSAPGTCSTSASWAVCSRSIPPAVARRRVASSSFCAALACLAALRLTPRALVAWLRSTSLMSIRDSSCDFRMSRSLIPSRCLFSTRDRNRVQPSRPTRSSRTCALILRTGRPSCSAVSLAIFCACARRQPLNAPYVPSGRGRTLMVSSTPISLTEAISSSSGSVSVSRAFCSSRTT